ncbi:solute carrier family 25 member 33 isoform X2 [Brachionichthys hirsutus]|uniref:solute carrier family 25 member 33 isoform X2 n=1 Tax=Brachionichthys hirsutus TaxID=412623 RepID=UPI003604343B
MVQRDTLLHLFAGGCSGTVGAIVTCPLEVLKTRLQSSGLALRPIFQVQLGALSSTGVIRPGTVTPGVLRGLQAIYFASYSKSKELLNGLFVPNSGAVHMLAAGVAAFATNSLMNPVWMVKTRMQLERKASGEKKMNALQCARYLFKMEGIWGFYRGLTASYAGISETMICFLIYETLKKNLATLESTSPNSEAGKGVSDFLNLMMAAAFSKGCASCLAYPHEVIRTRLREEGSKYKHFFQTGRLIAVEEGYAAFYRGLVPQLIKQIPNAGIVFSTYELIVYLLGDK